MSGAIATAAIVGGIGAAGSLGGAALASSGAKSAAQSQTNAANQAAQLQYQASQNALDFQKQQWNQTQQNIAPWLQMGGGALGQLGYLLGISPNTSIGMPTSGAQGLPAPVSNPTHPVSNFAGATPSAAGIASGLTASGSPQLPQSGAMPVTSPAGGLSLSSGSNALPVGVPKASPAMGGGAALGGTSLAPASGQPVSAAGGFGSLLTPYSGHFEAPNGLTMENDPGYQARLNLGTDAIQRSAAARGNVLTGGTAKALDTYAQDYASNEYNNVYNRALTGFQTNYNQYNNDQNNIFNRLAALSGVGQTAAGQLSSAGNQASQNISSNLLGTAQGIGQAYQNAGAANASGLVGSANAWGGALGGTANNLSQLYMLQNLFGGGGGNPYATNSGGALPMGWA